MSYNKVQLIGRVGKDPEIKHTQSGDAVASFSFVTSEHYKNKKGEKIETNQWHNIVIWRKLAEIIEEYVKKGDQLFLEGRIVYRSWDDKDGNKKYITEIVCDNMIMIGGKKQQSETKPDQSKKANDTQPESEFTANDGADDIPF
jgi:single-strand DNA-binding protein